jgi:hypothetical protein
VRTAIKISATVLLIAAALMIVAPRVWVKNKKARLIYNGRISEKVKLFHGTANRLYVTIAEPGEPAGYVFDPASGIAPCATSAFVYLKLIAFELRSSSCNRAMDSPSAVRASTNALQFVSQQNVPVEVQWQDAPR